MTYKVRRAEKSDCAFIAEATMAAERAHVGVGLWDVFFGEDANQEMALLCLQTLAASADEFPHAHLCYKNFFVAVVPETRTDAEGNAGGVVASSSCYQDPIGTPATWRAMRKITRRVLGWADETFNAAHARLSFMRDEGAWPDLPIYDRTWWIETVYTQESYRGKGIAEALLKRCIQEGQARGVSRTGLLCAIGNDGAKRLYHRCGLKEVGHFRHSGCGPALHVPGFSILCKSFSTVQTVVLTGGPCAGKTTAIQALRSGVLPMADLDIYIVPEVPTMLGEGGATYPGPDAGKALMDFEVSLLRLQLETERAFVDIANSKGRPALVVCDRGAMDVKAYLPAELWQRVLKEVNASEQRLLFRYDAVCHLVTAADGAESFYNTDSNSIRTETAEQARVQDQKTLAAWAEHPQRFVVDNAGEGGFDGKLARVVDKIKDLLKC